MPICRHKQLSFEPSRHAVEVGYKPRTPHELFMATLTTRKNPVWKTYSKPSTFPAPLVLPGDDLSFDPDYDSQTVYECFRNPNRRVVLPERESVYVVPVPKIDDNVSFVDTWARAKSGGEGLAVPKPKQEDVVDYLAAFYHGVPVKVLEKPSLSFMEWEQGQKSSSKSRIGLKAGREVFGIRHRPSKDGLFAGQLNLNDLLDVAMAILPKDGYAVLMLVDHDLYEDEADDFCCGRAYGGSGVSVVSYARYDPAIDQVQEVETEHAWPASHCAQYIEDVCAASEPPKKSGKKGAAVTKFKSAKESIDIQRSAMHAAVKAYASMKPPKSPEELSNLWLGRICKTASHELGHCFGMDHCVYYACVMQGTSGLTEDAGQPPYLCPVDASKVLNGTVPYSNKAAHTDHCTALLRFCERFPKDRLFRAYEEWLKVRLTEIVDDVAER